MKFSSTKVKFGFLAKAALTLSKFFSGTLMRFTRICGRSSKISQPLSLMALSTLALVALTVCCTSSSPLTKGPSAKAVDVMKNRIKKDRMVLRDSMATSSELVSWKTEDPIRWLLILRRPGYPQQEDPQLCVPQLPTVYPYRKQSIVYS